ncbi:MAG: BACON domain-containing protein [Alistipes sp.]|nr:BACON domain-containing protein [Alistipes sp.]
MRIKHLLLMAVALPLLFVACKQNDPVDEVKNPTIELTAGEATDSSLSFTITTTEAESVAWLAIEASEATPTASEVLANGTKVEANKSVECSATDLEQNTEYTIVAAVKNSKAVDKKEIKMTTESSDPASTQFKRKSAAEAEFTAEGGKGEIEYEIVNPIEGTEVEAEADVEWIAVTVGEKISFVVEGNTTTEAREGKITATYGELSFDVKVKQAGKPNDQPVDEEVNFTASVYEVQYYGTEYSAAYNYMVYLSDTGLNENGHYKQNGEYYMLDIYAADSAENNSYTLPNGKYTASETPNAGTFGIGDYGAHIKIVDGVPTYSLYKQGTVTVSDGKIEAKIMMEDGTVHNVLYEGNLRFDGKDPEDPEQPIQPADVELTADKWLWNGSSNYGNKYQVVGEGFSVDAHFPAQFAQEDSLTAGDYTWTTTTMFGYNDFENEFTTRSFTVDGVSVAVDSGSAKVTVEGEEYAIELALDGRDGVKYLIAYNGKLNDKGEVGGDGNIVITTLAEGVFNSSYGWYTFKGSNDTVTFDLIVNDYQSTATLIEAGSFSYAPMKSFSGSEGFFYVDNFKMDGIKYKPQVNSTMVVTNDGANVGITLNLFMDSGDELVVVYNGPIGEGGDTPAEPTKLDTPSVAGLVSGNAATISWQAIAGAKDYSVSLNGTFLQTVETAYIVLTDLEYSTTYSVSVVANPADTAVNTASDAGTASFTTEADPNAGGGDEPENPGDNEEEWVGREVKLMLLAYQDNTLYSRVNNESIYIMTNFRNGITAGKFYIAGENKSEDVLVAGHATSQYGLFGGTTSFNDGDTLEVIDNSDGTYTITYRVDINGDKITATYTGALE